MSNKKVRSIIKAFYIIAIAKAVSKCSIIVTNPNCGRTFQISAIGNIKCTRRGNKKRKTTTTTAKRKKKKKKGKKGVDLQNGWSHQCWKEGACDDPLSLPPPSSEP